jgi:hypothetical protein
MEMDRIKEAVTPLFGQNKTPDPSGSGRSIVRIIVTVLVIAGLAWFAFTAVRDLIIYGLYFRYVDELAAKTGLNKYLINVLAAAGLAPFLLGIKYYFFSLKRDKRTRGAALLLGMTVVYTLALFAATKDNVIGRFYAITPDGVKYSDSALDDGREWLKVTRDNMWYVTHLAVGKRVDAAGHDWFDQKSGLPLLWYSKLDNQILFYDGPGFDRFTAEPLKPVTKELYLEWRRSSQSRTPAAPPVLTPSRESSTKPHSVTTTNSSHDAGTPRITGTITIEAPVGKFSEGLDVPSGVYFDWGDSSGAFLVKDQKGSIAKYDPAKGVQEDLAYPSKNIAVQISGLTAGRSGERRPVRG